MCLRSRGVCAAYRSCMRGGVLCIARRRIKFFFYISVKYAANTREALVFPVKPLETSDLYSFSAEDAAIYSDAEDYVGVHSRREFPGVSLSTETTSGVELGNKQEIVDELLKAHHHNVELLKKLGVNPCSEYKSSRVENILTSVKKDDRECPICKHKSSSAQKLKEHIRGKHAPASAKYHCDHCPKLFASGYSLTLHQRVHTPGARKHPCPHCNKAYVAKHHLTDHLKTHETTFKCIYCTKVFNHERNCKDHERVCQIKQQGGKPEKTHKCRVCSKAYVHQRDLRRHQKASDHL